MHAEDPKLFGKVAVVMGGTSAEREVSLNSGKAVLKALQQKDVNAFAFDTAQCPLNELNDLKVDRVFNALHGRGGEDGQLQGALELLNIPYTGSGVLGSALGMDKLRSKLCWQGANMATPAWRVLSKSDDMESCASELGFPLIIKPALEGSSIGMAKVTNLDELTKAWQQASQYNCDVIAEQWITGAEFTVAILAGEALPAIRLETPHDFYDYEAKYHSETTQYFCPCGLDQAKENQLKQLAIDAFEILGGRGWGRVDFMLDEQQTAYLLEINTVPGMTDHSLVPMAAKQAGIDFNALVWNILETSIASEAS